MAARGFSGSPAGAAADPGRGCRGGPHMVGGGRSQPVLADISDELGHAVGHDDGVEWSSCVFDGCVQVSSRLVGTLYILPYSTCLLYQL